MTDIPLLDTRYDFRADDDNYHVCLDFLVLCRKYLHCPFPVPHGAV